MSIERFEKIVKSFGGLMEYKVAKITIGTNSEPKVLFLVPIDFHMKNVYDYLSLMHVLLNPVIAKKVKGSITFHIFMKSLENLREIKERFDYVFEVKYFDESIGYLVSNTIKNVENVPMFLNKNLGEKHIIVPFTGLWDYNLVSELNFYLITNLLKSLNILDLNIEDVNEKFLNILSSLKNYREAVFIHVREHGVFVPRINVMGKVRKKEVILEIRNVFNEVSGRVISEKDGVLLSISKGFLITYSNSVCAVAYF